MIHILWAFLHRYLKTGLLQLAVLHISGPGRLVTENSRAAKEILFERLERVRQFWAGPLHHHVIGHLRHMHYSWAEGEQGTVGRWQAAVCVHKWIIIIRIAVWVQKQTPDIFSTSSIILSKSLFCCILSSPKSSVHSIEVGQTSAIVVNPKFWCGDAS